VPLVTRVLPAAKGKAAAKADLNATGSTVIPVMAFPAANLLVVEYRPAADLKGIVLHLREVAGQTTALAAKDIVAAAKISRLDEVNVLEQPLKTGLATVTFQPWETKFIKLSLR
jgi:alpha-mannosidase